MTREPLDAAQFLARWGFSSECSVTLRQHAELCAQYAEYEVDTLAVALNLAPLNLVRDAMAEKPTNVLPLEHLTQSIPSLREHSLRLLALSRGMPFLASIDDRYIEGGASLAQGLRARLDELNAALIVSPDERQVVVFSDLSNLLTFLQAGRIERKEDPLRSSFAQEPVVALAPPAVVARAARAENARESISVVSSAAQDNFWSPNLARTDAERILARLLDEALMRKATDIEFAPLRDGTVRIRIRIYGDLTTPDRHAVLPPDHAREITNFLVSRSRAGDGGRLRHPADGQLTYKNAATEVFIRCSFIPADRYGLDFDMVSVSLRLLARTSRNITLGELNLPTVVASEIRRALVRTQGLIVLAGPTNSGKSTTIAGVVGEHVEMFGNTKKRLSLEDPVERYLDGITQISVDSNFAELMRALLRHDPDLVWVGEIRDAFSAAACVRAATSGHVVLSTVHANNSILAFRAISNYLRRDTGEATGAGASLFDLAESVSLLIGQRLVKRLCPHCRRPHKATNEELQLLKAYLTSEGQSALIDKAMTVLSKPFFEANPQGCKHCSKTGYIGELPVSEVLPASREVRDIFSQSETRLDFNGLAHHRMNTLSECALDLLAKGETEFASLFI